MLQKRFFNYEQSQSLLLMTEWTWLLHQNLHVIGWIVLKMRIQLRTTILPKDFVVPERKCSNPVWNSFFCRKKRFSTRNWRAVLLSHSTTKYNHTCLFLSIQSDSRINKLKIVMGKRSQVGQNIIKSLCITYSLRHFWLSVFLFFIEPLCLCL